jgi:Short C-terminal domain
MHHHHMHGGFGGFGMGMGGGLLGDLLAGGLGYYLGSRSAQQNQQYVAPYPQYVAPYPQYPQTSAPVPANNTLAQLKLLGQLRESGILTEEEFQEQKQRILNGF